ncbi:MAG: hypothetical protein KAI67_00150 [Candidatus Pacebacteria bacterium]|nr:hypothetical protein [Candidatus Paceibacterota bacterium]
MFIKDWKLGNREIIFLSYNFLAHQSSSWLHVPVWSFCVSRKIFFEITKGSSQETGANRRLYIFQKMFMRELENIVFNARVDLQSVLDILRLEGIELWGLTVKTKTKMKFQNKRNWFQTSSRDNIILLLTKHFFSTILKTS